MKININEYKIYLKIKSNKVKKNKKVTKNLNNK